MLLALTMVFSLVPTFSITASAEDSLPDTKTFKSGGCDITFTKNADGETYTARVATSASGNGVMASDITMGKQPYEAYQSVTTKLVIDDSVMTLGQGCFCRFAALKEIKWPETLRFTEVPPQAFLNSGLETIVIPEGITKISSTAFLPTVYSDLNHLLKRVELPSTITQLGIEGPYQAFAISANASQVMLICNNAYSYNWAKENGYQAYQAPINKIDGTDVEWSYSTDDKRLSVVGSGSIPDYTESNPAPWAGYADQAKELYLGSNLTEIGNYAFFDFTGIVNVSVPKSVSRIGDRAFGLSREDILDSFFFRMINADCTVSSTAMYNRTKIEYTGFPPDAIQCGTCGSGSNQKYADNAYFYLSTDGVLVIFGTGAVGDMNFDGKNAPWRENRTLITGVEVQDGITQLGMGAFAGLPNLLWEKVNITTGIKTYGSNLFCYSGNSWDVVVPAHITSLHRTFVFGNGYQSGTPDIKSITFENPNTQLDMTATSQIVINGGRMAGVTIYYRNNGEDCTVKAFAEKYGCTYVDLDTVASVKTISEANLQYETVNGNTLKLSAINKEEAISVPTSGYWLEDTNKESFTNLELADGIINIPDGAFDGYTGLKQISIPTTLTTIGSRAFAGNGASQVLVLELPHSVTSIGADAFAGRTVTLKIPGESSVADYAADGVDVVRTFKFLLVGNSFSQDAAWGSIQDYSQTWRVFDSLMEDDVELTLGLIQTGGKGLGWHATMNRHKVTEQDFRVAQYKNGVKGKWTLLPGTVLSDAFAYEEWDGISLQNNSSGVENDNDVDEDLKPVSAAIPYLLDRIQENAPYAKVYMYNVWQYTSLYDTIDNVLAATEAGYLSRIALSETTEAYTSTDGELGITGTVHAATAVQNARTTYLATLSNNIGKDINTTNDNVMGLQRDGVHISYSIGRYIVGLTFAKTVIPASLLKENAVDAGPRASEVIGEMPAEYVEIARAAVDAAITTPKTLTRLSGYTIDPAVTAQTALNANTIVVAVASSDASKNAVTTALHEKLASDLLRNRLHIKTLEDGLMLTMKDGTLVCDNGEYRATVTVQYGYTFKEANISGHIHTLTKTEAKKATCTENGNSEYYSCAKCNKYFSDAKGENEIDKDSWIITAASHAMTKTDAVPATCTEPGVEAYWTCTKCSKVYSDAEGTNEISDLAAWKTGDGKIAADGHDYGTPSYTWSADGKTCTAEKACTTGGCTEKVTENGVITSAVKTPATCTTKGITTYTATFNGGNGFTTQTKDVVDIPATGHNWGDWTKVDDTNHQRVCKNDASHVETAAHSWDNGVVTKQPSYGVKGEKTFTCTVCEATRVEEIPALIYIPTTPVKPSQPDEPATPVTNPFVDVSSDAYYYDAVLWAVENGIASGTGDGTTFSPNASCTRAQMVTFLWRAAGCPEPKGVRGFGDVAADTYYAKAVAWAVENGITGGVGENKFAPDAVCTRAQMAAFLCRMANGKASSSVTFTDVSSDAYYAEAVQWAAENGITVGTGDGSTFSPDETCTRGQMVTFLYRYFKG